MIVLPADVPKAEKFAREQRLRFAPLMKVDTSKVSAPADMGLLSKVAELAESDPMKWDAMLAKSEVVKLFACGALHFNSADSAADPNAKGTPYQPTKQESA